MSSCTKSNQMSLQIFCNCCLGPNDSDTPIFKVNEQIIELKKKKCYETFSIFLRQSSGVTLDLNFCVMTADEKNAY